MSTTRPYGSIARATKLAHQATKPPQHKPRPRLEGNIAHAYIEASKLTCYSDTRFTHLIDPAALACVRCHTPLEGITP